MIRRLRVAHRVAFMSLAAILPIGLAFAVLSRPSDRTSLSKQWKLVEKMRPTRPPRQAFAWFEVPADSTIPFGVELAFASEAYPRDWIEFTPLEDPRIPDLLIYATFMAETGDSKADLPPDVVLVESLNSTERLVCPWPRGATDLILYSLAKSRRVGSIRIEPNSSEPEEN